MPPLSRNAPVSIAKRPAAIRQSIRSITTIITIKKGSPWGCLFLRHFYREGFAAQDVEVQVVNSLTCIGTAVGNHPVATGEIFRRGDFGNDRENMGNYSTVFFRDAVNRRNVGLGDHQNVGRCLGGNIPEGQDLIIFIYLGAGNITLYDLAK